MFNDEPDSNQIVMVDIVFDREKIEYIHKMALKYDLNPPKVIPRYELRVEVPIGELLVGQTGNGPIADLHRLRHYQAEFR